MQKSVWLTSPTLFFFMAFADEASNTLFFRFSNKHNRMKVED